MLFVRFVCFIMFMVDTWRKVIMLVVLIRFAVLVVVFNVLGYDVLLILFRCLLTLHDWYALVCFVLFAF